MALVTGAGQGIGQAIALALAERGAQVIAADLKRPHETVNKIGSTAYALELDVTQQEQWRSALVKSRDVGDVDIVVNNAGYFPNRSIEELDSGHLAKNACDEPGLPLLERKILLADDEKEEVGPLRRGFV